MDPAVFDLLLSGEMGSRVQWLCSHRCPCTEDEGGALQTCTSCLGTGIYYDTPSTAHRCGVIGLSERDAGRMARRLGPALVGDAQISIPPSAPFWGLVKPCDRILVPDAKDTVEWVITRRAPVRLPMGAAVLSCYTLTGGVVVTTPPPVAGPDGRILVNKPHTVRMSVPRLFEVIEDAGHVRAWQGGLPVKFALKRIDITTR
jgi:hypothetical protein